MKKRIFRKFNVLAAVPLVFALAALLTAMIAPINAFAFDIGGSTAQAWVDAGSAESIGVTLEAIPANEGSHLYIYPGADDVFDAPDRDTIGGRTDGPFGLGVDNTLINSGTGGSITSQPSEIGYYGKSDVCGTTGGQVLGTNCADELRVKLDQAVNGGSVTVSFFYGSEQSGETLQVALYNNNVLVYSETEGPASNGTYSSTNPGLYTFDLGDVCWDEIRFIGDDANVDDATDFLVEGIADLTVCEPPPEISFTQGFFGASPKGEALVAGLINDNNCDEINTILTSIGASEVLDCVVPAEKTESPLSHFLTGKVGPGKEKGAENIGFLPSGFGPHDNLAAQKITVLLNMELEGGINSGNFLNIDPVDGLDPILTTGGQLGTCKDLLPLVPGDGICDDGTVVLNALGEVVALLDAAVTTVGDVLVVADEYIEGGGEVDPTDTVTINGVPLNVGQLTKILGMINESYDAGTPTGFVTVSDVD